MSARPASSASVPASTRAGSPGIMRTPVNTMMLIIASVTVEMAMRWIRYSSTATHAAGAAPMRRRSRHLLPGRALDADEAVGHGLVALEALRVRDDIVRVIQVDDVAAGGGPVGCLLFQPGGPGPLAGPPPPGPDHVPPPRPGPRRGSCGAG